MPDRSGTIVAAFVAAIALVVGVAAYLLGSRPEAAPKAAPEAVVAAHGVEAREFDRARVLSADLDEPTDAPPLPNLAPALPAEREPEREREPQPPQPPPPPLVLTPEQLAEQAAYQALQAEVTRQVQAALRDRHRKLKDACWDSKAGEMAFNYNMSFGSDGKLLAVGFSQPRAPGAGGVGQCLSAQPLDLQVDPPGKTVSVDVELHFP